MSLLISNVLYINTAVPLTFLCHLDHRERSYTAALKISRQLLHALPNKLHPCSDPYGRDDNNRV